MPDEFYREMIEGYAPAMTTEIIRAYVEGDFERFDALLDAEIDRWLETLPEGTKCAD